MQGGHDPLLNASAGTVGWIREKLTVHAQDYGVGADDEEGGAPIVVGENYASIPGGLGAAQEEQNQCRIL